MHLQVDILYKGPEMYEMRSAYLSRGATSDLNGFGVCGKFGASNQNHREKELLSLSFFPEGSFIAELPASVRPSPVPCMVP